MIHKKKASFSLNQAKLILRPRHVRNTWIRSTGDWKVSVLDLNSNWEIFRVWKPSISCSVLRADWKDRCYWIMKLPCHSCKSARFKQCWLGWSIIFLRFSLFYWTKDLKCRLPGSLEQTQKDCFHACHLQFWELCHIRMMLLCISWPRKTILLEQSI